MARTASVSNQRVESMNLLYRTESAKGPNATFISTWGLFTGPRGRYASSLPDTEGQAVLVRSQDGIHIALPAGGELLATFVLSKLEEEGHIRLCGDGPDLFATPASAFAACPAATAPHPS